MASVDAPKPEAGQLLSETDAADVIVSCQDEDKSESKEQQWWSNQSFSGQDNPMSGDTDSWKDIFSATVASCRAALKTMENMTMATMAFGWYERDLPNAWLMGYRSQPGAPSCMMRGGGGAFSNMPEAGAALRGLHACRVALAKQHEALPETVPGDECHDRCVCAHKPRR